MGYISDRLRPPTTTNPLLVCAECRVPTRHSFRHFNIVLVDDVADSRHLFYECIRCGLSRRWGAEAL